MAILKEYWRIITFGLVCLASIGAGVWAYMAGSGITEQMQAVDRLRVTVESAGRSAVNMQVVEARQQEIERANAEFEASMDTALALQMYNPFLERVDASGKVIRVPREPLLKNVLPTPGSNADAISFRNAYATAHAELTRRLKARGKATADEVRDYFERWDALQRGGQTDGWRPWGPGTVQTGAAADGPKKERSRAEVVREYPRSRLAEEIARKIYMYVDDGAFGIHDLVRKQDPPTDIEIWQAQMSLWIQQDMAAALARVCEKRARQLREAGHENRAWVAYMPVKRLMKVSIDGKLGKGGGSNQSSFTNSFTDIKNDERKFVVPIALEMVVEEAALPEILDELCRVGFYTPISVKYEYVRPNPLQDEFVYGDAPVVEVRIELEGYFFRKVFDEWIPPSLKDILRTPDAKDTTT